MSDEETVRVQVTLRQSTYAWIVQLAEHEHRPVSNYLAHIVEQFREGCELWPEWPEKKA